MRTHVGCIMARLHRPTGATFMVATLLAQLGGCATAPTTPAVTTTAERWSEEGLNGQRYVTDHFTITSTIRDEEFDAALPGFVEAVYERCAKLVPPPEGRSSRMNVYVFGTRPEWQRFTRRRFPARYPTYECIRYGGFTEGDTSVSFYTSRSATLATLAHEIWHQYAATRLCGSMPAWLNEGLACYVEALEVSGDTPKFRPLRNTFRINALCDAVREGTLLSLDDLLRTDAGAVITHSNSRRSQVYYAQVWALITFLRHGDGGHTASFGRLLQDLADGSFAKKVSAARLAASAERIATHPAGSSYAGDATGPTAFAIYFGPPHSSQDAYFDHLVRTCQY